MGTVGIASLGNTLTQVLSRGISNQPTESPIISSLRSTQPKCQDMTFDNEAKRVATESTCMEKEIRDVGLAFSQTALHL